MSVKYVRFQRGTQAAYDKLKENGHLNENTLYFIYDESNKTAGSLYMGERLISGGDVTFTSASLDELADVIVAGAETNSFLIKEGNNWVAKTLEDVVALIKNNFGDVASTAQIFQVTLDSNESHEDAIERITADALIASGDVVIVKELITDDKYQHTAYIFDNKNWAAMDGNYSAASVYTSEDIQVTTAVGELAANAVKDELNGEISGIKSALTGANGINSKITALEGKLEGVTKVSTAISDAEGRAAQDATTKANKALTDAKAYTDELANGQVNTNKNNIADLQNALTGTDGVNSRISALETALYKLGRDPREI